MRAAGLVVADALRRDAGGGRARGQHRRPGRDRRGDHPGRRRRAVVQGLPRLPGLDLLLGQRAGRARHPERRPGAARGRPDLDRLRRDARRLARRRGDHRRRSARSTRTLLQHGRGRRGRDVGRHRRRRPGRRSRPGPAHRHLPRGRDRGPQGAAGTASSTATAGTASAPRCTRTRTCSTTAGPGKGPRLVPGHGAGHRADDHDGLAADRRAVRRLDRGHPGRLGRGARRAHDGVCDDGVWVLTAADGGRARLGDLVTARQPAGSPAG